MTVEELEKYFKNKVFDKPIQLNKETRINDVGLFIKTHFRYIKSIKKQRVSKPYYDRLIKLYEHTASTEARGLDIEKH